MTARDVKQALLNLASADKARSNAWFFKSGPGQYGEGDEFIGVNVPDQRVIASHHRELKLEEVIKLIASPVHEHRLTGLFIMVDQFNQSAKAGRQVRYEAYLKLLNDGWVNNWDLIDSSAPQILGAYLADKSRRELYRLASGGLWQQRAAILATFYFIREDDFTDCLSLAEELVDHPHDLIHKAVGWMLREIGNRDRAVEELFLAKHYKYMPRTMLRYAIEKFPNQLRRAYLEGKI
ncbi:MAG TPA: DNA alkylation repair protein [Candidatus Saccharimonadales bacterium]